MQQGQLPTSKIHLYTFNELDLFMYQKILKTLIIPFLIADRDIFEGGLF